MEDGNNFGVTVQLQLLKHIHEQQEKLSKSLEELTKYHSSRADAVEKCKLPNQTQTTTVTKTQSDSSGTDKEKGDTANQSTSQSTEQKQVESKTTATDLVFRQDAVVAVDLVYYSKAKNVYDSAITSLMAVLDFYEKNAEKIEAPRVRVWGHVVVGFHSLLVFRDAYSQSTRVPLFFPAGNARISVGVSKHVLDKTKG
jgi:hypothetical protein